MASPIDQLIEDGKALLLAGDTAAARRAFDTALECRETGEIFEGLAEALYLGRDYGASATFYERAYTAYRHERDRTGAGRVAFALGWIHGGVFGQWAVERGWYERSRTMLEEAGPGGVEHARVLLIQSLFEQDVRVHEEKLREAIDVARRFHEPNIEFHALGYLGSLLVITGRVEEGMVLFDEALAAACAGEVTSTTVVDSMFCGFFWCCERINDVSRAEQWMRRAEEIISRRNVVAAFCRAHYGGILTAAGRFAEAEAELREAARHFDSGISARRSAVLIRLADLRVRQGRLEEAAQLLEGIGHDPEAARPLAALHLYRGETTLARALLEQATDRADDEAPGAEEAPMLGPQLALLVEVHLEEGDAAAAASVAQRLGLIANRQGSVYLKALAALAAGQVCVATGDGDARACLRDAIEGFAQAQLPLELARTRFELARALTGDRTEVAVAEAKAALEGFERLQAARHADAAAALLRSLGAPIRVGPKGHDALTKRETEVLALIGHGLSNPEIADRLYISRKTVQHHVGSILSKLGLRSRAEAAAHAARQEISP